jgi:hypothetical protein
MLFPSQLCLCPLTSERSAWHACDLKFVLLNINYSFAVSTSNPNLLFYLENHYKDEYMKACKENGWPMQLAKHKIRLNTEKMLKQTTLDSSLCTPTDRVLFTHTAFHRTLINFIVADNQSINVIKCWEFRDLIILLHAELDNKDIPHHTKVCESII